MITAVDSNVLIDVLGADPVFGPRSRGLLRRGAAEGVVVACETVWAEVLAAFPDPTTTEALLDRIPVAFDPMGQAAARRAAAAWGDYRRRGGPRTRIVSDFLVGAHALEQADRLLTRDRGFYREAFGGLAILDPTAGLLP